MCVCCSNNVCVVKIHKQKCVLDFRTHTLGIWALCCVLVRLLMACLFHNFFFFINSSRSIQYFMWMALCIDHTILFVVVVVVVYALRTLPIEQIDTPETVPKGI